MKLFGKSKQQKSIDDFKSSAAHIDQDEAINAITGGTMSGCHKIGGGSLASLSSIRLNAVSLNVSANLNSIAGF